MNILEDVSSIIKKLMLKEPFYGIYASTLDRIVDNTIETAGVSKKGIDYQLFINKDFWESLQENNKIGLIKHELMHICFSHPLNRHEYPNHILYNIAADIEINQYIEPQYYPTPDILLPSSFPELNLPLKAGTKEYYKLLQKALDENLSPTLCDMMSSLDDFHGTWVDFDDLSEAEKRLIKNQTDFKVKEIVEGFRGRGNVPSELKEYIDELFELKEPSYDWKSYLRRFSSFSSKTYTHKTRRKDSKRYEGNPALRIKTRKKILVGIDTSGSVGKKDLQEFFSEIYHIYKAGNSVTIAECDTTIHKVWEYKGMLPEYVEGRGGTDMNPLLEYMNKHKDFSNIIILTDGFIPEKSINIFKPILVVISSKGSSIDDVKKLGWGNAIKIKDV